MSERPAGEPLTNPRAERVRKVAALAGRSARSKAGMFLAEGPQAVREAVLYAAPRVRDLYLTADAAARYGEIVAAARAAGIFTHEASDDVLHAMSADCQGVLAVVRAWDVAAAAVPQDARIVAILADVRDPGNAGTVIRTAHAAGADLVILAGESVDIFSPKVVRATAGSLFHVPVARGVSLADAVDAVRAAGLMVLAADGGGDLELHPSLDALARPHAWLFGNEARGLDGAQVALADAAVRIPMPGDAESLNLAAAAAVCLFASVFARGRNQ